MNFSVNHPILYVFASIVIGFVLFQSFFFLRNAWKRAIKLGVKREMLIRVIKSSIAFTIAPALAILIGLITLSSFLGLPLPWLRLSVLGALTYELPAAASVANQLSLPLEKLIADPSVYISIAWVMTLGILSGIFVIFFFQKRMQSKFSIGQDQIDPWREYLMDALFIGMIAAFLGMVFSKVTAGIEGWIPVFVLLFSAGLMIIQGILIKKYYIKWLENYALPFSMVGAMAFAIILTHLLV